LSMKVLIQNPTPESIAKKKLPQILRQPVDKL